MMEFQLTFKIVDLNFVSMMYKISRIIHANNFATNGRRNQLVATYMTLILTDGNRKMNLLYSKENVENINLSYYH